MGNPVILVVGAGPGVSGSVAKRFARDGHDVALAGLDEKAMTALAAEIEPLGVAVHQMTVDVTDDAALTAAVRTLGENTKRIDVLHFNPSAYREADPLALTPADLAQDMSLGVGALLTAIQATRPFMSAGGRVTATGSLAADLPAASAASLGIQKAGLRNLIQSIDSTLKDEGVRAVSVTVRGVLSTEGPFSPDNVAEAIYAAASQGESDWQTEVPHPG